MFKLANVMQFFHNLVTNKMSALKPITTPFIKQINGSDGVPIDIILWDYSFRDGVFVASMYKSFLSMTDDYAEYCAVRFERL